MHRPASVRGSYGHKPSVAYKNQEAAKSNIQAKLDFLSCFVAELATTVSLVTDSQQAREALEALPSSTRQFNAWTGSYLSRELRPTTPLRANAQQTLKRSGLLASVDAAIKVIKQLRHEASIPSKKEERFASAVRRAKLAEELRKIAEREIVALKRAHADALERLRDLESQMMSLTRESKSRIAALEADLWKERRERAAATRSRARITSLRQVNRASS